MRYNYHFYASSIAEWHTGTDLTKLIKVMQSDDFDFVLYYVPLPPEAPYDIRSYTPVVEGIVKLGVYNKQGKVEETQYHNADWY